MNRALRFFLVFVGTLVGVGGISGFFIGPSLLKFALDTSYRNSPVVFTTFTRLDGGVDGVDYQRNVLKILDEQVELVGGEIFWRGSKSRVLWGRFGDEWDFISFMRLPQGAAFLDLITSSEYRGHRRKTEAQREREETYVVNGLLDDFKADILVVYLVKLFGPLQTEGIDLVSASVIRHGGQEVRRTPLTPVFVGDIDWNTLVVFQFENAEGLDAWLEDNERLSVTAIAGSKVQDHRMLVISR